MSSENQKALEELESLLSFIEDSNNPSLKEFAQLKFVISEDRLKYYIKQRITELRSEKTVN